MIKKIGRWLYYLAFAVIAVIVVLLIFTAFSIGGTRAFVVTSGSMQPAIKTGSVVFDAPQASYNVGDIITYGPMSKTAEPTTHRVVEILSKNGQKIYHTQGDANNIRDNRDILPQDILGKVRLTVPYAGYAVAAAKTKAGFGIIVVLPALVIIVDELRKIWLESKKIMVAKLKKEAQEETKDKPKA